MLLIAAGCSPEDRAALHASRAERFLADGRVADALIELQTAIKHDPNDVALHLRAGELYAAADAGETALFHFREAHRLEPGRVDIALRLAELLQPSDPAQAAQLVEQALRDHPDDARVNRTASALALAAGDLERALDAAREAIRLAPDEPASWLQLGRTRHASARAAEPREPVLAEALAAFETAARLAPDDVAARVGSARVLATWPGREPEAIAVFRAAIALAEASGDARRRHATARDFEWLAQRLRDPALQREALQHQVASDANSLESWERLAAVSAQLDGADAARAVYGELVAAWPGAPAARVALSRFEERHGRADEALAVLDRAIDAGLDHPLLHDQRVRLLLRARRVADARAVCAELALRHAEDPTARRARARCELAEGRAEQALALLGEPESARESAETAALRAHLKRLLATDDAAD